MDKGSDVHGKSGYISETVQRGDIVTTSHYYESYLTYETVAVPMTFNDIDGGAPNEDLLTCDLSYIFAAIDKISALTVHRAVTVW